MVQDANYNVVALMDNSGNVVERYGYDPFGQVTVLDANWNVLSASAFGWLYLHQGGRLASISGLYHFRHRDYSPTLGRWISLDPLRYSAGDVNLYRFVFNAPTVYTDPTGQIVPILILGGVAVTLAGVGTLLYTASRYDYAFEHYLAVPIHDWTPELEAEFQDYVETTKTTEYVGYGLAVTGIIMTISGLLYGFKPVLIKPKGPLGTWLGGFEFHGPEHGLGWHFELIIRGRGGKNFYLIIPGKEQWIVTLFE